MENQPSARLVDQRIRNRIMEAVEHWQLATMACVASGPIGILESSTNDDDLIVKTEGCLRSGQCQPKRDLLLNVTTLLDDAYAGIPKVL